MRANPHRHRTARRRGQPQLPDPSSRRTMAVARLHPGAACGAALLGSARRGHPVGELPGRSPHCGAAASPGGRRRLRLHPAVHLHQRGRVQRHRGQRLGRADAVAVGRPRQPWRRAGGGGATGPQPAPRFSAAGRAARPGCAEQTERARPVRAGGSGRSVCGLATAQPAPDLRRGPVDRRPGCGYRRLVVRAQLAALRRSLGLERVAGQYPPASNRLGGR